MLSNLSRMSLKKSMNRPSARFVSDLGSWGECLSPVRNAPVPTKAFYSGEVPAVTDMSLHGLTLSAMAQMIGPNTIKQIKGGAGSKLALGRWGVTDCDNVSSKVNFTNFDHCGPCGTLELTKA